MSNLIYNLTVCSVGNEIHLPTSLKLLILPLFVVFGLQPLWLRPSGRKEADGSIKIFNFESTSFRNWRILCGIMCGLTFSDGGYCEGPVMQKREKEYEGILFLNFLFLNALKLHRSSWTKTATLTSRMVVPSTMCACVCVCVLKHCSCISPA